MGLNKKYDGYESYQYLEKGVDYKDFEMPDEMFFGKPNQVDLSDEEEERMKNILKDDLYISLHEHPFMWPKDMDKVFEYASEGRCITAFEWLADCYYDAIFDNLLDGVASVTSKRGWKWNDVIYDLGMRLSDIAHSDFLIQGRSIDDIKKAHDEGKIAIIPTLESSTPIENEVDRIDILHGLGVRMMGIVYSESNNLATGLKEDRDGGLTYFGRAAVDRMNKVGMAIDVSHASDQTCLDVCEASNQPIFITHAGARAIWDSKRLKPDEVLKACAETGGVIGIEAAPHTTVTEDTQEHSIKSFMEHFEYVVDLVGIDNVSFGPDTLYGDHVGLHHAVAEFLAVKSSMGKKGEEPVEVDYVKGLENPTESSQNIIRWLVKHGYSDKEIEKVIGGNTLSALEEIW